MNSSRKALGAILFAISLCFFSHAILSQKLAAVATKAPEMLINAFQLQERDGRHYILPASGAPKFSISEILHLCHSGFQGRFELTITPTHAIFSDLRQDYLETCYPIEISTSQAARSMGHCSDFAQYIFHGGARLSTDSHDWDTFYWKAEACKNTSTKFLHGEYPVWQLLASNVTNLWLPNLEQVSKEDLTHVPNYAMILCKTKVTCRAFDSYLVEQNLTKPPRTLYMSHSSPDVYQNVVEVLGETKTKEIKQDFNQFLHVYGGSGRKSTADVLKCWSQHPLWPKLTIVGKHSAKTWMKDLLYIPWNVDIRQSLSIQELRTLQLSHGVHLCPSSQEGYGHYINEARSLGALVLTTDHAPMNEFVDDGVSGVLVQHNEPYAEEYQAMAPYFISPVGVSAGNICDGVKRILSITMEERRQMGLKARKRYESDDALMISNFEMLKANT